MSSQLVRESSGVPTLSDFISNIGTPIIVNSVTGIAYILSSTGIVMPLKAGGLIGTTTNDSAATGYVGEYLPASLASGSATSLTTATSKTVISQSLTAGDWEVWGIIGFIPNASTSITQFQAGISITNNTLGAEDTYTTQSMAAVVLGALTQRYLAPRQRISIASTTTIYLIANATFTVNVMTAFGSLFCRRMR
jgi:hypothetical protein